MILAPLLCISISCSVSDTLLRGDWKFQFPFLHNFYHFEKFRSTVVFVCDLLGKKYRVVLLDSPNPIVVIDNFYKHNHCCIANVKFSSSVMQM